MSPSVKTVALTFALASSVAAKEFGCFTDKGSLQVLGEDTFQSQGSCISKCVKRGNSVAGLTKGNTCACGDEAPTGDKAPDSECGIVCPGYPEDECGGENAWLILSTGEEDSAVRTRSSKRDDDPTGEDEANDADDPDDNADDTDGGNDDSDPTGEDQPNDADDPDDNADDTDNGNDDSDPTGDDQPNDADDPDDNDDDDNAGNNSGNDNNNNNNNGGNGNDNSNNDSNNNSGATGTQGSNEDPTGTDSGSSPTETNAASRLGASAASFLAIVAFAVGI